MPAVGPKINPSAEKKLAAFIKELISLTVSLDPDPTSNIPVERVTGKRQGSFFCQSGKLSRLIRNYLLDQHTRGLVFLDRGYCHYQPLRRPLDQIVFSENGAAVREVMIDGRFVFRDDRLLTLDEAALAAAAAEAAARLDALNAPARETAEAASALIRSFCPGPCGAGRAMETAS